MEVCSLSSILEISDVEMCCKIETRECSENGLYTIKEECPHYMFDTTGYENRNRLKFLESFTSNVIYYDDRQHRAQPRGGGHLVWKRVPTVVGPLENGGCREARQLK